METRTIYEDIKTRTNGDIYIGVVGPVRVGKSTFITRFMEEFVIPNIENKNTKTVAIDELPQSADGVQIMTTQPKFVPAESVNIKLNNGINMNVKLIDCVGYFVEGATGENQDGKPRMVKTPWSKEALPLVKAAELGTQKVINDHSSIAVMLTTDSSFGEIKRESFEPVEERMIGELKELKKPFVIAINSKEPNGQKAQELKKALENKYGVGVVALNAQEMGEDDVSNIFEKMLCEFPLSQVEIGLPNWLTALPFEHELIQEVVSQFKGVCKNVEKVGEIKKDDVLFSQSEKFMPTTLKELDLGTGKLKFDVVPKEGLFYEVLSSQCGMEIEDDFSLVAKMKGLSEAKKEYDKLKDALIQVNETGYGVVLPTAKDLVLDEPEIVKQGGNRYGVKLRATAPSLHIMRVDLETEISPMVGSMEQSKDLVEYLEKQGKDNPNGIWQTNVFGKSVEELMTDGLSGKVNKMPVEAQKKMRKTLTRIVNEGKGGIICILL